MRGRGGPLGAGCRREPRAHPRPLPSSPRPGSGAEGRAGPRPGDSWLPARWAGPGSAGSVGSPVGGGRPARDDPVLDRTAPGCLQGEPEEGSREAGTAVLAPGGATRAGARPEVRAWGAGGGRREGGGEAPATGAGTLSWRRASVSHGHRRLLPA